MGLISHGIAAGIGYYLAQPDGRRRLTRLGGQVQERGRDLVGDRAAGRHARSDLATGDVTVGDLATKDDLAPSDPVVDASVPLRGRRLRRQRNRENRRRGPSSASPTPDPRGDQAR